MRSLNINPNRIKSEIIEIIIPWKNPLGVYLNVIWCVPAVTITPVRAPLHIAVVLAFCPSTYTDQPLS